VASLTRDRLPLEAWRALEAFRPDSGSFPGATFGSAAETISVLNGGLSALSAFGGLLNEGMPRNFGWRFLDLGRRLERAANTAELLLALFGRASASDEESRRLHYVLELTDAFTAYRSRYRLGAVLSLVLDLIMMDESNPRSLAFQFVAISEHLEALPQASLRAERPEERRMILALLSQLRLSEMANLVLCEPSGERARLAPILKEQSAVVPKLSEAITRRYFSPSEDEPQRVHAHMEPPP
jgi:uncharacterized alpha-E superfamily protein